MANKSITIDDRELKQFLGKVQDNSRAKRNFLKEIGVTGENYLQDEAEKIAASSALANSMRHDVFLDRVDIGSRLKYAPIALETGRAPGRFPPIDAMEVWAMKRGMGREAGYLVARSVAMRGTQKYRRRGPKQFTKAAERLEKEIDFTLIPKYLQLYD